MSNVHPMVEKAARAWCKRHAEACGLDEATLWAERAAGFITEAQAALEACGALELERDARRYRWLRERINWRDRAAVVGNIRQNRREWMHVDFRDSPPETESIDEYIDAAIASAEGRS